MNEDALLGLLGRSTEGPDAVPDTAFVDALEQRLLAASPAARWCRWRAAAGVSAGRARSR